MLLSVRQFAILGLVACAAWGAAPVVAQEPIWHYSPYQIRIWLALAPSPELNAAVQDRILRGLHERAEAVALAPWTVQAEPSPAPARDSMLAGLEWLSLEVLSPGEKKEETPEAAPLSTPTLLTGSAESSGAAALLPLNGGVAQAVPSPPPDYSDVLEANDKLVLVHIAPKLGGFAVEARELDCRTRQWSEVITRHAAHAALLPLESFRAVEEVFRPVARIESAKGKSATVRVRAGGLVQHEENPAYVPDDAVFLPVVRFNDRYGKPRPNGIQVAPWTFLVCQEHTGAGRLACELVAGVATPLSGRSSSRIEKYGLMIRPQREATDMIVLAQPVTREEQEEKQPLAGYEVYERLPDAEGLEFVGRSDWRGLVEIGKTDRPLRVLYVKNGGRILSRFPIVPGWQSRVEVRVMNDDRRLEVEGFVSGMQSRITDLVVAREVLALRIRKRIQDKNFAEADALMREMRAFPTRDQVQADLNREEARQRLLPTDRRTKAQIDKLFSDTRAMINKYLDSTLVERLSRELNQARAGS